VQVYAFSVYLFVIIFEGLERFFVKKIKELREYQLKSALPMSMGFQIMYSLARSYFLFVCSITVAVFVRVENLPQEQFTVDVIPSVSYLQILSSNFATCGTAFQLFIWLVKSVNRMGDYLLSPEIQDSRERIDDGDVVISMVGGTFKWGIFVYSLKMLDIFLKVIRQKYRYRRKKWKKKWKRTKKRH
jgi:hypothetical protein